MRRAAIALAITAVALAGCKRQKPPAMTRVWLGAYHGCATVKSGGLECWGANDAGQLGDGTKTQSLFPVRVTASPGAPEELAIGGRHTCGIYAKQIRCWGDDSRHQLAAPTGATFTVIAAAGDRTCTLGALGVPQCWGDGHEALATPDGLVGSASLLAVGPGRVCAAFVAPTHDVRCNGADDRGQSAGQKPVLVGASIKGLAAGGQHTCALLEDGSVQCWGDNALGQLGDSSTTGSAAPVLVHGLPAAVEIRANDRTTCARLWNNTVACWGANDFHQLANGTTEASARPQPLSGLVGAIELSLGGEGACARLAEGGARCWGRNQAGQMGDGSTADHDVPMPVRSPLAKK